MAVEVSLVLNDKIVRYVQMQQAHYPKSITDAVTDLLEEWYETKLQKLHHQYLSGDLTLRGMARQLGLEYYELYDLMESKGLII